MSEKYRLPVRAGQTDVMSADSRPMEVTRGLAQDRPTEWTPSPPCHAFAQYSFRQFIGAPTRTLPQRTNDVVIPNAAISLQRTHE